MADLNTLQGWLSAAEDALHKLTTGQQVVEFDRGGTKIRYTPADVDRLRRYISDLRSQIAALGGGGKARRILYVQF